LGHGHSFRLVPSSGLAGAASLASFSCFAIPASAFAFASASTACGGGGGGGTGTVSTGFGFTFASLLSEHFDASTGVLGQEKAR